MIAHCLGIVLAAAPIICFVRDENGKPLRATVRLLKAAPPWTQYCENADAVRLAFAARRAVVAERTCDAQGRATLPAPSGAFDPWIEVTAQGRAPEFIYMPNDTVVFSLNPAFPMELQVDTAGATVDYWDELGARHTTRPRAGTTLRYSTGNEPCALVSAAGQRPALVREPGAVSLERQLPDGWVTRRIRVIGADEATLSIGGEPAVTVRGVAEVRVPKPPAVVTARAPGLIGVTVIEPDGAPDVAVGLHPVAHLDVDVMSEASVHIGAWQTGIWRDPRVPLVADVPAGTHLVTAKSQFDAWAGWMSVDADAGRLRIPAERPRVSGRLFAVDGGWVERANVRLDSDEATRCRMDMGFCGPFQRFTAFDLATDGQFSLAGLDPGEYRLIVWAPGAGMLRRTVKVPSSKLKLTLEPGRAVNVHVAQNDDVYVFEPDARGLPQYPALGHVPVVNGVARIEHVTGRVVIDGASASALIDLSDAGDDVELGRHVRIDSTYEEYLGRPDAGGLTLSGTVRGLTPFVWSACAGGRCAPLQPDGRFVIGGLDGGPHPMSLVARDVVLEEPVFASAADEPVLVAVAQRTPRLVGPDGRPIANARSEGRSFTAPHFAPLVMEYDPERDLAPATLAMRPLPVCGHAPPGASVTFLCRDAPDAESLHWAQHTSDVGPVTTWTHWPEGVRCVVATQQAAPDGTFCLDSLHIFSRPIVQVEARVGARVQRLPFGVDAGLDFEL